MLISIFLSSGMLHVATTVHWVIFVSTEHWTDRIPDKHVKVISPFFAINTEIIVPFLESAVHWYSNTAWLPSEALHLEETMRKVHSWSSMKHCTTVYQQWFIFGSYPTSKRATAFSCQCSCCHANHVHSFMSRSGVEWRLRVAAHSHTHTAPNAHTHACGPTHARTHTRDELKSVVCRSEHFYVSL